MLFDNALISLLILETTLIFFICKESKLLFLRSYHYHKLSLPAYDKNICSYTQLILSFSHFISSNISHLFCIILWLYNHLSFVFDLTKCSGSGNIDTFLTLIQITQNETSLIEINHPKIIHSTNDHKHKHLFNSSFQNFFYPVDDTMIFIATTSKSGPTKSIDHLKHRPLNLAHLQWLLEIKSIIFNLKLKVFL